MFATFYLNIRSHVPEEINLKISTLRQSEISQTESCFHFRDDMASDARMTGEQQIGKHLKLKGRGLKKVLIPAFT
jgi:hypothetical protein